jgi:phosphoribosylformimino-5-aminoimidazole carboxamide ribotide isomerase
MVLIIPTIPIQHGLCGAQIAALAHETHFAEADIYSQDPIDRARLLRKENSKMINLQFMDTDAWEPECIAMIKRLREAVDIPLNITLCEAPTNTAQCQAILDAGAYRIFLPIDTAEEIFLSYCQCFSSRKMIPTVDLSFDFRAKLPLYKERKVERIAIDISPRDSLESNGTKWSALEEFGAAAKEAGIRLTVIHGVRGYPELKHLQDLGPAYDSLVLGRALNENRFPCQLIWREMEAAAAFEVSPASNLWTNPLEGKEHI